MKTKQHPHNFYENLAWQKSLYCCGIDEVGRGCLAGPLVTAAAILPINTDYKLLKDSKVLTEAQRNKAFEWIQKNCFYSVAISSHKKIDTVNIYQATLQTMKKSLLQLMHTLPFNAEKLKYVLIDAMPLRLDPIFCHKDLEFAHFNYGETISSSIAAASIVAKVTRDRLMERIANNFPSFNFEEHKGYGTKKHQEILNKNGATILHRRSFLGSVLKRGEGEKQGNLF
jgi:ribonuclease HII